MHEGIHLAAGLPRVDTDESAKCLGTGCKMGDLASIYLNELAVDLQIDVAVFANFVQNLENGLVVLVDYTSVATYCRQDKHKLQLFLLIISWIQKSSVSGVWQSNRTRESSCAGVGPVKSSSSTLW